MYEMSINLRSSITGCAGWTLILKVCLFLFLSWCKSSILSISLRHELGLRGRISWILGGGVPGNLCPFRPLNSGNRFCAAKNIIMLNKILNPWNIILVDNDIHPLLNVSNTKIFQVKLKPPDFEGQLWTEILVVSLKQPVLDLIHKDGEDNRVCPDVLVLQADQVTAMGGNFVKLA